MAKNLTPPDPERFNLTSFADLLPAREQILGEDPGSFKVFHDGMVQSLAPLTPYECVIAENLISIEWELFQHRRMRDAAVRKSIRNAICDAAIAREKKAYQADMEEAWEKHVEAGGTEDDWQDWYEWDDPLLGEKESARTAGLELARKAVSTDPKDYAAACAEIEAMGLTVIELMGEAYQTRNWPVKAHEDKLLELERRRREVKRDFDAPQNARPFEGEVIEG
jgi:hypothetical protein